MTTWLFSERSVVVTLSSPLTPTSTMCLPLAERNEPRMASRSREKYVIPCRGTSQGAQKRVMANHLFGSVSARTVARVQEGRLWSYPAV